MAHHHLAGRGSLVVMAAVVAGCGPSAAPPPAVPPPTVVSPPPPPITPPPSEPPALDAFPSPAGEPRYTRVVSKRLALSVPLPNRSGWVMVPGRSSFLALEHQASASTLLVSIWREDEIMNRARCEERARLLRNLPSRASGVMSSRVIDVPKGFDTQVDVGFDVEHEGGELQGWALAFGGLARECFAFVYTTTASGDDAERIVGDRLAVMQTLALEGIERRPGGGIEREPPSL